MMPTDQFMRVAEAAMLDEGAVLTPGAFKALEKLYRRALTVPDLGSELSEMQGRIEVACIHQGVWDSSCHWYSQAEWQARGELFGNGAELTLIFEGQLCHAMQGEPNWFVYNMISSYAAQHGFWFELGYHWSLHFYLST